MDKNIGIVGHSSSMNILAITEVLSIIYHRHPQRHMPILGKRHIKAPLRLDSAPISLDAKATIEKAKVKRDRKNAKRLKAHP